MTDDKTSQNVEKSAETTKEPGLRGVRTTSVFKLANFELFVKPPFHAYQLIREGDYGIAANPSVMVILGSPNHIPIIIFTMVIEVKTYRNKKVMGAGGFAFLLACGYIAYIRYTDEYKDVPTYTSLNEDGTFTRRVKKSRWE